MASYIEREAFEHHLMNLRKFLCADKNSVLDVAYHVNKFPAADVAPVVHGRWVPTALYRDGVINTAYCSVCGFHLPLGGWDYYRYCPECGAKMDITADE